MSQAYLCCSSQRDLKEAFEEVNDAVNKLKSVVLKVKMDLSMN